MRLPQLAALALASALPAADAAACGATPPPAPHVLGVSSHTGFGRDGAHTRTFVVLDELAPANDELTWRMVAPQSYDGTRIADAPALAQPLAFTLVGPSGVTSVQSDRRVYLAPSWGFGDRARVAVEIDIPKGDRFTVAIAGSPGAASWHQVKRGDANTGKAAIAWLADAKVGTVKWAAVETIDGIDTEIVSFDNGSRPEIALRRGGKLLSVHAGSVLGALDVAGRRLLVLEDFSTVRM